MIRLSDCAVPLRLRAATLHALIAVLVLVSASSAVDLDFNVADGDYNVADNWVESETGAPATAPPGINDNVFIRNNGTVVIDSDASAQLLRIGASKTVQMEDPQNPGTFIDVQVGMPGTLNWTAGEIFGNEGFHTGGPDIRVGQRIDSIDTDFTGTVIQNGPTTKLMLRNPEARLTIGDNGVTANPTSSYTLIDGTIGLAIGGDGVQGANSNNGINVKNGTFTMLGGQIIDATPTDFGSLTTQRFLTIASSDAPDGSELVATATFTGGTVNVNGGIRLANQDNTRGYLNINGPVVINTGGDTSIGYNANNGFGEMNMSDGSLTVGNDTFSGRFQVGHRGRGTLNMSGGTIAVTREIRVGAEPAAGGSAINMTGGSITTPQLNMRTNLVTGMDEGASIILDGPSATFTHTGPSDATIGDSGKALFEVRQGHATLGGGGSSIELADNDTSQATLNLKGGKLTLGGPLNKSNTTAPDPVIALTGGILEFNNTSTSAAHTWQTDFTNTGSEIITKPNALLQVVVGGDADHASDFAMNSGSWDLEIGLNTLDGADWFDATHGTASLTGGTLNLGYINGFTPADGDVVRILRGADGVTLNSSAVTITGDPNWTLQTDVANTEIQLKYVASSGLLGDYNGNGIVDAADYTVWRDNPTNFGGNPGGYNTWKQNFGNSNLGIANGAAVPEPTTILLVGLFALAPLATRRPRRIKR